MLTFPDKLMLPLITRPRSLSRTPLTPKAVNFDSSRQNRVRLKHRIYLIALLAFLILAYSHPTIRRTHLPDFYSPRKSARSLDVTRSRFHKAILLPSVTQALHDLNATGSYRDWYGKPSAAGRSPFDYLLPQEWQAPLSWSFVLPDSLGEQLDDECPMSSLAQICFSLTQDSRDEEISHFIDTVRAVPTFHVSKIDPSRWYTRFRHIMQKPDVLVTFARYSAANDSRALALKGRQTVHAHVLEECTGWDCPDTASIGQGQITLVRHAFELYDLFEHHKLEARYGDFDMHLFAHWPWLADPEVYYPLKSRHTASEHARRILDVDGVLAYHRSVDISPMDYRQAEICLFKSTKTRRMSRDWVKAMLSGCVILSDSPTEIEDRLSEFIIIYRQGATPQEIASIAKQALRDQSSLRNKALRAFMYARQQFVPQRQIGRLLQLVEQHRSGTRGYEYPLPFSLACRQYADGHQPGWCE